MVDICCTTNVSSCAEHTEKSTDLLPYKGFVVQYQFKPLSNCNARFRNASLTVCTATLSLKKATHAATFSYTQMIDGVSLGLAFSKESVSGKISCTLRCSRASSPGNPELDSGRKA